MKVQASKLSEGTNQPLDPFRSQAIFLFFFAIRNSFCLATVKVPKHDHDPATHGQQVSRYTKAVDTYRHGGSSEQATACSGGQGEPRGFMDEVGSE